MNTSPAPSVETVSQHARQLSLDELDEPLRDITFVVVDLETTGGAASRDAITEIGAVKVRGGEVLGEFATLVNPGVEITAFITVLTGITNAMVLAAPPLAAVLPSFLEFAAGAVLVAHNAPFDIGFLKAACHQRDVAWPAPTVLDTAVLARRVLTADEVPNCKLATLAAFFATSVTPNHRALSDARATVGVLHGLIERLGGLGVQSLPELRAFTSAVSQSQRRKRHLADDLPHAPGVYVFCDSRGEPLYVGTSRDLRSRVRQYFVASERRSRMAEMVALAESVRHIVCAHSLEAQVRELRMIADLKPPYNRRSKNSRRALWLKVTKEAFPRLSIVRERKPDGAEYLGPASTVGQIEQLRDAIFDALPVRQCVDRLVPHRHVRHACVLAELDRCSAPCEDRISVTAYAEIVRAMTQGWAADVGELVEPLRQRVSLLSQQQRYEEAAVLRDRIALLVRSCARTQTIASLTRVGELVAARPDSAGGWELAVVRHGRLVAAELAPRGVAPMPVVESMVDTAEALPPPVGQTAAPGSAAMIEESEIVLRWLTESGVRLVRTSDPFCSPARGAAGQRSWLAATSRDVSPNPFADRRALRTTARPTRSASA